MSFIKKIHLTFAPHSENANLKYKITTSNEIADADWGKYIILDKKHFSEIDTNIEVLGNEFYKIISTLKELYNSQGLA